MESLPVRLGVISVVIGLTFFGCSGAWAEDWRLYAKTDLYESFYDGEDMIRSSQDIMKVWTKLEYTQRGVIEMLIKFGKHYENLSYSLELREINCTEKRQRLLSITPTLQREIFYTLIKPEIGLRLGRLFRAGLLKRLYTTLYGNKREMM